MLWLKCLIISFHLLSIFGMKPVQKRITVMVSLAEPFAFFDNKKQALDGLDVKIIENFGRKFDLKINYIVVNETLNEVFGSEDHFRSFMNSLLYL